jgi:hypothetical protein
MELLDYLEVHKATTFLPTESPKDIGLPPYCARVIATVSPLRKKRSLAEPGV